MDRGPGHPLISVLLPVRDGEATLGPAVESVLAQTERDFELLAVDDGSTDRTWALLEDLARRDRRVRPVRLPASGLVPALNEGLRLARGELVARMDVDDLCHPERLALQRAWLAERPELGLVASLVDFGGDAEAAAGFRLFTEWTNSVVTPEEIGLLRFVESPLVHPSVMFRAGVAAAHGGYRHGDFPEDYELWLRWLEAGVPMAKVPRRLLVWNDSGGRLSRSDPRYRAEAFYRLKARHLAAWLARHNPRHPEVWICGAGRAARRRSGFLLDHGVRIAGRFDLDPGKIGRSADGLPVLPYSGLPDPGRIFVLSFVAKRGAREDIRATLEARGYRLGRDWLPAA